MLSVQRKNLGMQAMVVQRLKGLLFISLLVFTLLLGIPQIAGAHAGLLESVPPANAELDQSPAQIVLTFNERLEDGVFWIKVMDTNKKQVTANKAQINLERTKLTLDLPNLGQGNYLVSYHVISSDGHPVDSTYLFAVGQTLSNIPTAATGTSEHLHTQGLSTGVQFTDVIHFISRIVYYALMLSFTGWVLWLRFSGIKGETARTVLQGWTLQLQRGFVVAFIFMMFTHLFAMVGDGGSEALAMLFTRTSIGYVWIVSLVLSFLGFVMLFRSVWLDLLWVVLIWLFKSLNGHAAAFEPVNQTVMLDVIHLAASSLWVAGLLMLVVLWKRSRDEAVALFPRVSGVALASLAVLVVSGVMSVFIMLTDVFYVVETLWGKLLLFKSALVLLVIATGSLLRLYHRRSGFSRIGSLLKLDAILALLIVAIVGIFTYLTPLPTNEPLSWHVMGEKIHMTAQISPNNPGVNDFTVKIWLPEELGKPKQVVLKLQDLRSPDIAPLEVPLKLTENNTGLEETYGMKQYTYKSRGAYLPYAGYWKLEVRAMNSNDDETVYEKEIRVF